MSEFGRVERAVFEAIEGRRTFLSGLREVVTYQEKWNENLRRYWRDRGFSASQLRRASDVPAVPSDVFRHLPLVSNEFEVNRVYRTSGTTSGARGEHHRFSTEAYDRGARKHFEDCVGLQARGGVGAHFLSSPTDSPDSSLVHMADDLSRWLRCEPIVYLMSVSGASWCELERLVSECGERPFFIIGTAFAFVDWLMREERCRLPAGSVVVETGGFKSSSVKWSRDEYIARLTQSFGDSALYFSEYSMTELSSQGYGRLVAGSAVRYQFPAWCRVSACDADSLEPRPDGDVGILRFVDLCNVETCVAVQTEDLGVVTSEGVELRGRHPGATPRGCSLAAKELLEGAY